jgi:hypothetical protein
MERSEIRDCSADPDGPDCALTRSIRATGPDQLNVLRK